MKATLSVTYSLVNTSWLRLPRLGIRLPLRSILGLQRLLPVHPAMVANSREPRNLGRCLVVGLMVEFVFALRDAFAVARP